jgi:DNA-binding LytR/AlgR family response regulator
VILAQHVAAVDQIKRVSTMPGGAYQVTLANGQLPVSRIQSRVLRETLLRL